MLEVKKSNRIATKTVQGHWHQIRKIRESHDKIDWKFRAG